MGVLFEGNTDSLKLSTAIAMPLTFDRPCRCYLGLSEIINWGRAQLTDQNCWLELGSITGCLLKLNLIVYDPLWCNIISRFFTVLEILLANASPRSEFAVIGCILFSGHICRNLSCISSVQQLINSWLCNNLAAVSWQLVAYSQCPTRPLPCDLLVFVIIFSVVRAL